MSESISIGFRCCECGNTNSFAIHIGYEWDDYDGIKVECNDCDEEQRFSE